MIFCFTLGSVFVNFFDDVYFSKATDVDVELTLNPAINLTNLKLHLGIHNSFSGQFYKLSMIIHFKSKIVLQAMSQSVIYDRT